MCTFPGRVQHRTVAGTLRGSFSSLKLVVPDIQSELSGLLIHFSIHIHPYLMPVGRTEVVRAAYGRRTAVRLMYFLMYRFKSI